MNVLLGLLIVSLFLNASSTLPIILLVVFFLPVIFQMVTGLKSLKGKIKIKFWIVSTVSIVSQILASCSILFLISHNLKQYGIRDGLGFVMALFLGLLMIFIILIVIGTQLIISRKKTKKTRQLTPATAFTQSHMLL